MCFRIWFGGVTHRPVRTGELACKGAPPTVASVRLAGRDFIVTSQVFPVRWQPNREVRWESPGFKYHPSSFLMSLLSVNQCVVKNVCKLRKSPLVQFEFKEISHKAPCLALSV